MNEKIIAREELTDQAFEFLSPRWVPLPNFRQIHSHYLHIKLENGIVLLVPSGRRSYKTETAKRKMWIVLMDKANQGKKYFIASPTYAQTTEIFWDDMKKMIPQFLKDKGIVFVTESNPKRITIRWDPKDENTWTVLVFHSMDKPERIEGTMWAGCIIDEIADCKERVWVQHVYPALLDSDGWAILLGVPEGIKFYRKNLMKCGTIYSQDNPKIMKIKKQIDGQPNWVGYKWKGRIVLSETKIQAMKDTMDERTYRQEEGAEMLSFEGAMYYCYHKKNLDDIKAHWDRDEPLWLGCDFNKSPMVWEVAQVYRDGEIKKVRFIDEVSKPFQAKVPAQAKAFTDRFATHRNKTLFLTGDASGQIEGMHDHTTSYQLITDQCRAQGWRVINKVPSYNFSVNNRVTIFNSLLLSMTGKIRCHINSKCEFLQRDFEEVEGNNKGGKDKDADDMLTHATDGAEGIIVMNFSMEFFETKPTNKVEETK